MADPSNGEFPRAGKTGEMRPVFSTESILLIRRFHESTLKIERIVSTGALFYQAVPHSVYDEDVRPSWRCCGLILLQTVLLIFIWKQSVEDNSDL